MRTLSCAVLFLSLALLPSPPADAARLVAVMPLDLSHTKGKVDADAQASLEEAIRDAAANVLGAQGWTVLSTEATLQGLKSAGVEPKDCGAETCQRKVASALNASRFVRSTLQFVDNEFTGVVQMIELDGSGIVGSALLEGPTVTALRKDFAKKSAHLFSVPPAVRVAEAPPPSPATAPVMNSEPDPEDQGSGGTPMSLKAGTSTDREASNPGANVPRSLWVKKVRDGLPAAVCDTSYFKQCFRSTRDECIAAAERTQGRCFDEQLGHLPDYFDPTSGNEWGGKIGSCAGAALENALLARKSADPKCGDASLWQ